jgi:hypothetical protein
MTLKPDKIYNVDMILFIASCWGRFERRAINVGPGY